MTRGLIKPDGDVIPLDGSAANVRAQIDPFETALRADPNDAAALVNEAAIYDRNNLEANALASYRQSCGSVERRRLGARPHFRTGRIPRHPGRPEGRRDLPRRENLRAADRRLEISEASAGSMAAIRRCRRQNLQRTTCPACAAAEFRRTRWSFSPMNRPPPPPFATPSRLSCKNRAGKKDTIFILVAGHGIVDSRGAYIMTYDSDPEDLSATALPMAELQSLVDDELSKVGRVVFLADVCRAADHRQSENRRGRWRHRETRRSAGRNAGPDGRAPQGSFLRRPGLRRRARRIHLFRAQRSRQARPITTTIRRSMPAN